MLQLMGRTFVLAATAAVGSTLARSLVNHAVYGSNKVRVRPMSSFYKQVNYPMTQVACPCCGGVFYFGREGVQSKVATVRETVIEGLPEGYGHLGIREDLERRGCTDRRTQFRSQVPPKG